RFRSPGTVSMTANATAAPPTVKALTGLPNRRPQCDPSQRRFIGREERSASTSWQLLSRAFLRSLARGRGLRPMSASLTLLPLLALLSQPEATPAPAPAPPPPGTEQPAPPPVDPDILEGRRRPGYVAPLPDAITQDTP